MNICSKDLCSGCGLCENLCLHKAIKMTADSHGFYYPSIDYSLCIDCGLCQKLCPVNNEIKSNDFSQKVYVGWQKNKKIRKISSSGGIFQALAKEVLRQKGVVAGVAYNNDYSTSHIIIDDEKDLHKIMGSKYIQAKTDDLYKTIKTLLTQGKLVLFSGTPCQVHALLLYLGKEYDNLITVDVICHGVPSHDIFKKYLMEITNKNFKNISFIALRYKKPCWSYSSVKIDVNNKNYYINPTVSDPYFNIFNFNYSLRNSCHNCKYTTTHRVSDITLADFWGWVPKSFKMKNFDNGVSCIILNSNKGTSLFSEIENSLIFENSSMEDAKKANKSLSSPYAFPENIDDFWYDYDNGMSITDLNKKYITKPYTIPKLLWLKRIKRKYMWLIKKD